MYEATRHNVEAYQIAEKLHPAWGQLANNWKARALLARDVHEVLGPECDDPVEIVVCWTVDGAITSDETSR